MNSSRLHVRLLASVVLLTLLASPAAARQRSEFGTLSIQVRPLTAEIIIDGERWTGPEGTGPLQVQLSPGSHQVELRAPGRRPYIARIAIRAGETTPLNVALTEAGEPRGPEAPPSGVAPAQPSSGGIVQVSRGDDGFVIAPDFRVTEIAHETSGLAGAYGGYVFGGQLLVGGGAYVQTNSTGGSRLFYGGPVVEWRMLPERTIGFNLHGLVGGGQWHDGHDAFPSRAFEPRDSRDDLRFRAFRDETFFVAEPEAQVVIRFGVHARLQGGIGYRATSVNGLSGASGSISMQFGR